MIYLQATLTNVLDKKNNKKKQSKKVEISLLTELAFGPGHGPLPPGPLNAGKRPDLQFIWREGGTNDSKRAQNGT